MARGAERPINEVRRRDRAVEDEGWIRAFLRSGAWGALATVAEGQPFINTNLYAYDEAAHAIYLHTARYGRTRQNLERGGRVCFSVSEMGRILPDAIALEFSVEYSGVTVFGRGCVVEDDEEKARGLQLLLDKYAPHLRPGRDYRPANQEELDRTSVFRIDIESWSGKQKVAAMDFPGAYRYEDYAPPSPFTPGRPGSEG
jgi:nitroimidazol reductase NimA-like FMN-containing flavoprotein (pyridoxamine 5'-phosphate oxidase superfamily)